MTKKEIQKLLQDEGKVLFIKKRSEISFSEYFFLGFLVFFTKGIEYDYLMITNHRVVTIKRNQILVNAKYENDEELIFNSIKSVIKGIDLNNHKINVELEFLRLTYEEIHQIKQTLQ